MSAVCMLTISVLSGLVVCLPLVCEVTVIVTLAVLAALIQLDN